MDGGGRHPPHTKKTTDNRGTRKIKGTDRPVDRLRTPGDGYTMAFVNVVMRQKRVDRRHGKPAPWLAIIPTRRGGRAALGRLFLKFRPTRKERITPTKPHQAPPQQVPRASGPLPEWRIEKPSVIPAARSGRLGRHSGRFRRHRRQSAIRHLHHPIGIPGTRQAVGHHHHGRAVVFEPLEQEHNLPGSA